MNTKAEIWAKSRPGFCV